MFRLTVGIVAAAAGAAGWIVYQQTNSDAIRARVIELIRAEHPDVDVQIGTAWVRPLGGLWLHDLRMARRDDPAHPFLTVASATVFHDKEQMAHGRLAIRKIELVQPVFRIRRDSDGNWNLPALPRGGRTDNLLPTLVIRKGTVQFEDRVGMVQRPLLELHDLSWTSLNDPLPRVSIEGQGNCLLGALKFSGSFQRTQSLLTMVLELPSYTITPEVVQIAGGHVAEIKEHLAGLEGKGDARVEIRYQPGARQAFQPTVQVNFRQGRLTHSRLPLSPLDDIELIARYHNERLTLDKCRARSGQTLVTVDAEAAVPLESLRFDDPEQLVKRFHLSIENLTLSRELFEQLPDNLKQIHKDFKPNGPIGLTFKLDKRERWWSRRCIVRPLGISAEYVDFPYPIRGVRGKLEQITSSDGKDQLLVNLTGLVAGQPAVIEGESGGSGSTAHLDLKIHGRRMPMDEELLKAMGDSTRAAVEEFHPAGEFDFGARIRKNPGDLRSDVQIQLDFKKLAICYEEFPYPLENLTGTLRIRLGKERKLTFENFVGTHHGGEVSVEGENRIGPTGHTVKLRVRGAAVPADSDFDKAMTRVGLQSSWRCLRPGGRVGLLADLEYTQWKPPSALMKPPSKLTITCHHFEVDSVKPSFFPYELTHVSGSMLFSDGRVIVNALEAHHHDSRLQLGAPNHPCVIVPKTGGGLWARVVNLRLTPFVPDEELLSALPLRLRSGLAALEASGPMSLTVAEFIVDTTADRPEAAAARGSAPAEPGVRGARVSSVPLNDDSIFPWMFWDGVHVHVTGASLKLGVRFENVHGVIALRGDYRRGSLNALEGNLVVDQATTMKQPVQNIHAQLVVDSAKAPGVLQVKNLKAKMFGGDVGGEIALMFDPLLRYDVRLNALGMRMEEIDQFNRITPDGQLAGRAEAHLYLAGEGADLSKLRGGGLVRVPNARIYSLPPLLDLLKFLKFHKPDGTAFEEAYARFRIQGKQVQFEQIDLLGRLISLTGEGTMELDGSNIKLDIFTVWSRLMQLMPSATREVPNSISRGLYKISMSGSLTGKLEFQQEALPFLVEPVKRMVERMQSLAERSTSQPSGVRASPR